MKEFEPGEIVVEAGSEQSPIYRNLRRALPNVPFTFVNSAATPTAGINPNLTTGFK